MRDPEDPFRKSIEEMHPNIRDDAQREYIFHAIYAVVLATDYFIVNHIIYAIFLDAEFKLGMLIVMHWCLLTNITITEE